VVIGLTGVMFVVAVIVMVIKALVIARIRKDNKAFLAQYETLNPGDDPGKLDQEENDEEKELAESEFLSALVGKHDHFQSSPLYHIYHAGIQEVKKRVGNTNKPLTPEALHVVRVKLDSIVVRESQRLNSKMVLLTIAIAGGPFLGLLGTVVGVMITFAVIAATGDVNINSIAPGIAAALLATVAGLAVAIPALFAYNYLLTQIKDIIADMRVFSDEFLAMLSERVADRFREAA
jgi:biopolymer transport protein ExbB